MDSSGICLRSFKSSQTTNYEYYPIQYVKYTLRPLDYRSRIARNENSAWLLNIWALILLQFFNEANLASMFDIHLT
jgi:hypothetical protein